MKLNVKTVFLGMLVLVAVLFVYGQVSKPSYADPETPHPIRNNPDAAVQIVEFGDIQCPACGAAHPVVKQLLAEFGDDVGYEFRHFPLTQIHPYAQVAAEAAECANDQGKYYEYIDYAFERQSDLSKPRLKQFAGVLGLNQESFDVCLDSGEKRDNVQADAREGRERNVQGTPTFFINGRRVPDWRYAAFRAEIAGELGQ